MSRQQPKNDTAPAQEAVVSELQKTKRSPLLVRKLGLFLFILSLAIYGNTLQNKYAMDDVMMINANDYVKEGVKGIPKLLTTPHLKGYANYLADTYRPLSLVMFAVEYDLFGENPAAGHLMNILVFAGCVLLLFFFLDRLFDGKQILLAFLTSLLFAVHPIHTEVVANIKSRDELLGFFFSFLALNIFLSYMRDRKWLQLVLGGLCFFLSMISKETSFTFVAIIPIIFFFYKNEEKKRAIPITVVTVFIAILYVGLRAFVMHTDTDALDTHFTFIDNALIGAPTMAARVATAILIFGHYLKLMFIPYPLISDYSYNTIPFASFGDIWVWLSLIAYLGLGALGIYRLVKKEKDPLAFGILFYLVTLSLFNNVLFDLGATQADRFTFFASTGACLALALAIQKWVLHSQDIGVLKSVKVLLLVVICVPYAVMAIDRNTDWKDDYSLDVADVEKAPDNTKINCFYGIALHKKFEEEPDPKKKTELNNEAIRYLQRSIDIFPDNISAQCELGTSFILARRPDSAIFHFKQALAIDPKATNASANLATLYAMQGMYAESIPYYARTIAAEPKDVASWFNLGISYIQIQRYDSCIYAFKRVIALDPTYNNYNSYGNTAVAYKMMGRMDSAQKYLAIYNQYKPKQ